MVTSEIAPVVTGISPAEGPPGTLVKIRGENLGKSESDLLGVFICAEDCTYTAEWKSSRLIHARTGVKTGMGDIIVFTSSGNMGTCMVKFRGYNPRVGLLTEAAVWVDESKLFEEKQHQTASLSNRRAYSPNLTYTDPLGVAPEETGAVLPADKIEEWYPKTSGNPLSEEFSAARFLLERHLDTGFDALKSGYYHLQSKDTRKSVGPTSFVRGHLSTILEALHTLNEVSEMHTVNESESNGGNICEELQGVLKSCDFVSHSLFKDILQRKDDCDAKRNVLNVLHRYRFLFNLPRSIEKSIQQREYEILISDYNRAKALFQNTEVTSFKKALAEVDQKISAFSTQLKQKLFDFPTPLEEQKKIIRYLNDLDYPGNAGWECITKQALWIKSMLLDCQVEHQMLEINKLTYPPTFAIDMRDHPKVKAAKESKQRKASDTNLSFKKTHQRTPSLPEALHKKQMDSTIKTPAGILMVESLCELIAENLSDLWNLGQTYLSHQLGEKKDQHNKQVNERDEFQAIVKDVLLVFCEMVQTVLQPDEYGKLTVEKERRMKHLVPWLPSAVKCVRTTLERLNKLGLASDIISPLKALSTSAVGDCIKKVLSSSVNDVGEMSLKEKWVLDYSPKDYCISLLPSVFQKTFMESVSFAHDYLADSKLDNKDERNREDVRKEVIKLLGNMLEAFLLSLEKTVYKDVASSNEELSKEQEPEPIQKDHQVLVLLSNCEHVKKVVMPRVLEFCIKKGFHEIQELNEEIDTALRKLDERVFNTYIDMKGEPLVGEIELGINQGESAWDIESPVKGIRRFVQDILMSFTVIHNQVSSVSTQFIERIFPVLYDMITEEFLRIFECIQKFSAMGALQARVELEALRYALESYMTENSKSNMEKILTKIPSLGDGEKRKMEEIMEDFKKKMRYQLATFKQPDGEVPSDPKENIRNRALSGGADQRHRDRAQSNEKATKPPRKKQSGTYKLEVQKSIDTLDSQIKPIDSQQPSAHVVPSKSQAAPQVKRLAPTVPKVKRQAPVPQTKRQAPTPQKAASQAAKGDNPFLDDEDENIGDNSNPFLDDDENTESGNPFLDDGDDEESKTSNPFLDD
ncbi:exocyst complex component 2-like isoform X2 [Clytia hemisphaerica]|uniref:Exocyst complex component 2 n=1 Tax=Clytia hemisphaerica TaxID=252671 RepID=A0A7M5X683_9CNID